MTFDPSGAQQFPIPTDGKQYPCFAPWGECMSYTIQNKTDQDVTITDNAGRQFTTPAGATETINHVFYILNVKTNAATTNGTLTVAIYREARDVGTSYPAVSISGPITISGTVTMQGSVTITGPVVMTNVTIETNTGTTAAHLQDLLNGIGSTRVPLTSNNGPVTTASMIVPISHFTILPTAIRRNGTLTVQTIGPGVNNNGLLTEIYHRNPVAKLAWVFDERVPVGFSILINFTGDGDFSVSY